MIGGAKVLWLHVTPLEVLPKNLDPQANSRIIQWIFSIFQIHLESVMSVLWDGTILWIYYCKSQQEVMTLSSCDSQSCGNMTFKLYTIDMVAQTGVDIGVTENQDARQDNKPLVAKRTWNLKLYSFRQFDLWNVELLFVSPFMENPDVVFSERNPKRIWTIHGLLAQSANAQSHGGVSS